MTIAWTQIIISAGFICFMGIILSVLLLLAEKKILNYGECSIDINNSKKKLNVRGGDSLLSTLAENNIFIPSACGGRGTCAFCKVQVVSGAGMIGPVEAPSLSDEEVKKNIRLSCQVKVRENINIVIPDELFSVKRFKGVLKSKKPLTHDILELTIELKEPAEIDFTAGQYVQLESEEYKGRESVIRAYSVSSSPSNINSINLVIRKVPDGICTTWVFDYLKEGNEVRFSGPYGKFILTGDTAPAVFIAGGSGMAPILSMLTDMKEKGSTRKAYYFFGAATQKDLFYYEYLKKMESSLPDFKFIPALSNEPEGTGWNGERGLITETVKKILPDMTGFEGYLCGSPGMINACIKVLTSGGIKEEKIFYDKF